MKKCKPWRIYDYFCFGFFSLLHLNKSEWVEDIQEGECSLKGFLSVVGESIDERESRKFKEEMDSKVLSLYRMFC